MWKVRHESWCIGTQFLQSGMYTELLNGDDEPEEQIDTKIMAISSLHVKPIKTVCSTCFAPAEWVDDTKQFGKVTINKIAKLYLKKHGVVTGYIVANVTTDVDGNKVPVTFKKPTDVVGNLIDKQGAIESSHCYECNGTGTSASDIIVQHHAKEVSMVFTDGTAVTVADGAEKLVKSWEK